MYDICAIGDILIDYVINLKSGKGGESAWIPKFASKKVKSSTALCAG